MFVSTNIPIRIELYSAAEREKYLTGSAVEIRSVLASICEHGSPVTIYLGMSADFLLSSLLEVGPEELLLDLGAMAAMNVRARRAELLYYVTHDGPITVQFSSGRIGLGEFQGRPAFTVPLPDQLLRLQRRDYYRIATPLVNSVRCVIGAGKGANASRVEVSLLDISVGGMAVIDHQNAIQFEPESVYDNCRILLPDGPIDCAVLVRDTFEITLRNGQRARRSGCQFVNTVESMRARIQRYINRLERERHARDRGLA